MEETNESRRDFLKRAALLGGTAAIASIFGSTPPAEAARPPDPEGDPAKNLLPDVLKFYQENPAIAKQLEDIRQSRDTFWATEIQMAEEAGRPIGGVTSPVVDAATALWAIRQPEIRKFMKQAVPYPEAEGFHQNIEQLAKLLEGEPPIELVPYNREKALGAAKGGESYHWGTEVAKTNPLLEFINQRGFDGRSDKLNGRLGYNDTILGWYAGTLFHDTFPVNKLEFYKHYNYASIRKPPSPKDAQGRIPDWGWYLLNDTTKGLEENTIPLVKEYRSQK